MRMSYHIDQKCMKPMGGNPPENYEECMRARLCRPMIAKHSHIHRIDTCKYTYTHLHGCLWANARLSLQVVGNF